MRGAVLSRRERRELAAQLGALPVLTGCTAGELDDLVRAGASVHIPAGWPLIQEGTPADRCYLVLSGEATVRRRGEQLAVLERGAVFGEVSLAQASLRTATVVSSTEMLVFCVPYENLAPVLSRDPGVGTALLGQNGYASYTSRDHE